MAKAPKLALGEMRRGAPKGEPLGPGLVARQRGGVLRRLTVYLPPELAKQLHFYCVEHGKTFSDVGVEAFTSLLAGGGKK